MNMRMMPVSTRIGGPKRSPSSSSSYLARMIMFALGLVLSVSFTSAQESLVPSDQPSMLPSQALSSAPSDFPSLVPSNMPSTVPTNEPSVPPSLVPSALPSAAPSVSLVPSTVPTISLTPSIAPSLAPTSSFGPSAMPSGSPIAVPSSTPSYVPTGMPSVAPTAVPTVPPTATPTVIVVGDVFMVLRNVVTTMRDDTVEFFNQQFTTFFQEKLAAMDPPVIITEAVLDSQSLLPEEGQRLRRLQGSSLKLQPLEARVMVTGKLAGAPIDFGKILMDIVNSNENELIDLLQEPPVVFFQTVQSIIAQDDFTPTDAPTAAPREGDDGLATGAIAGIAVGGACGLALMVGAIFFIRSSGVGRGGAGAALPVGSMDSTGPPASGRNVSSVASPSWRTPGSEVEVTASENQSHPGTQSIVGSLTDTDLGGADTMSYAYSLDAGNVDPSLASGQPSALDVPPAASMVGTTIGAAGEFQVSKRANQITREVIAPPGKLGIIIDTTPEGPVVHKVNKSSPLEGVLFPGDIIAAIDATDTRAMSASAITALMVQTANQQRRLTVLTNESQ